MKTICKKCGASGIAGTKCKCCSKMIPESELPVYESYEPYVTHEPAVVHNLIKTEEEEVEEEIEMED